jgi:hypothetical protein
MIMIQICILKLATALEQIGTTIFSSDTPPDWPIIFKRKRRRFSQTAPRPNPSEDLSTPNEPEHKPSNQPENFSGLFQVI